MDPLDKINFYPVDNVVVSDNTYRLYCDLFGGLRYPKFGQPGPNLCNFLNPLSPNSDQKQISPNNIHTLSRDKVMRINKMIIIEKIP